MLAALGAEVIHVGRPPEAAGSGVDLGHYNYGFDTLNTGKTWIGLDLKHPEGMALVKQLVARCDVVLDNFRPGVMQRLGLDPASLAAIDAPDLAADPALNRVEPRRAQRERIDARIAQWAAARDLIAAHAALSAAGVAAQPSSTSADLWADPQLQARSGFQSRDDRGTTRWAVTGPWRVDGEDRMALATAVCLALAQPAAAQARYPAKQITLVVPSAAGGGLDVAMRHTAKFLQDNLSQPVIVENRPSVNLLIGTRYVAQSAPDGYTILAMPSTFLGAPVFSTDPVGYDPFKDFIHVSATATAPNLLLVTTASGVTSVRDLIQRIRAAGAKKMTYGTAGTGSSPHVAAASFIKAANLDMIDVPYKGTAAAMIDLIGGRLDMLFDSVTAAVPHVKAGTLRALGATTAKRSALLPDVPTMAEALNQPDFDLPLFYGIAVPAKTPDDAIRALHVSACPEYHRV